MILNNVTLPDPSNFNLNPGSETNVVTLISGARRFQKINSGYTIRLTWNKIDSNAKNDIVSLSKIENTMTLDLDGKSYSVVSSSSPRFERLRGSTELYNCTWELSETS